MVLRVLTWLGIALSVSCLAGCVTPPAASAFEAAGCEPYPWTDPYEVRVHVEDPWLDRIRPWGPNTADGSGLTGAVLIASERPPAGSPVLVWSNLPPANRPPVLVDLLCLALWTEAEGHGPPEASLHMDTEDGQDAYVALSEEFARHHGQAEARWGALFIHDDRAWLYRTAIISPWPDNLDDWRVAYEDQRRSSFMDGED